MKNCRFVYLWLFGKTIEFWMAKWIKLSSLNRTCRQYRAWGVGVRATIYKEPKNATDENRLNLNVRVVWSLPFRMYCFRVLNWKNVVLSRGLFMWCYMGVSLQLVRRSSVRGYRHPPSVYLVVRGRLLHSRWRTHQAITIPHSYIR